MTAAVPSAASKGKDGPDSVSSRQRHFLPNDLAGALRRLDDVEIDALLARASEDRADSLTIGKLNAVRAAFKAGVKPSAIARQFGISQSDVRRVLAQGPRREA
jgi:predicted anti-sigma-YlaC factor YlaD